MRRTKGAFSSTTIVVGATHGSTAFELFVMELTSCPKTDHIYEYMYVR